MALIPQTESKVVYLQVKHFCLWRELKKPVAGCEEIEVTNPKTGEAITKHGFKFGSVSGRATKLVKYDTEKKYATRFFGYKLHLVDGVDQYVVDMPYTSQMLRRFLRVAPAIDWTKPLTISVFKGKNEKTREDQTAVFFTQNGEKVKSFFTRETPRGMPEASYDKDLEQWDFRAQHRWLIEHLRDNTIPAIEQAAAVPPAQAAPAEPEEQNEPEGFVIGVGIDDDDVPF